MTFYKQCKLQKKIKDATFVTTSYIPEKYAVKGKFVKLKGMDCEWADGWEVVSVGERKSEEFVKDGEMDHTRQRKTSDI